MCLVIGIWFCVGAGLVPAQNNALLRAGTRPAPTIIKLNYVIQIQIKPDLHE